MKIMWFCIPAFGHTNPTIEVVRELVRRGHEVRYYSFEMFREKIIDTGAEYIACDEYLMKPDRKLEEALKRSSTTAMSLNAIETTIRMNDRLTKDVTEYQPDLIVSDSVCFWGKLLAEKYQIPLVCSTTTFAFNQYSSRYMKYSFHEICGTILGSGKVKKALKQLEPLGYHVKNALELVQNRNDTDTIVYASKKFQPFSDTFDAEHYCFAGPSVRDIPISRSDSQRPLIYISLGTVVSDHPDFYRNCIQGLQDIDMDVLISCGSYVDMSIFSGSSGKYPRGTPRRSAGDSESCPSVSDTLRHEQRLRRTLHGSSGASLSADRRTEGRRTARQRTRCRDVADSGRSEDGGWNPLRRPKGS